MDSRNNFFYLIERYWLSLILLFSICFVPLTAFSKPINLVILGTSDLHANISGYRYDDPNASKEDGLARIATYVDQARLKHPDLILIDNGDATQGTILTDDIYNKHPQKLHPFIQLMNAMQYDAMTLGDHEFNFGLSYINKISNEANFPILAANVNYYLDDSPFALPYQILKRQDIKIGIIGLTNPNVPKWDGEKVSDLNFTAIGTSAAKFVHELKQDHDIDLIIISAHAGLTSQFNDKTGVDAASEIIRLIPDADVLLLGHSHEPFTQQVNNTLVGQPRHNGADIVRFDITLKKQGNQFITTHKNVEVIPVNSFKPKTSFLELTQDAHEATLQFLQGKMPKERNFSDGKFGVALADFQPKNEIKGIPQGRLEDTAVVELINRVQLLYSGADVSSASLYQDESDIKAGDITYSSIFNIYRFDNKLYVVNVTGQELKNYMEWSAAFYNTYQEGDLSISFSPERSANIYDMFEGISYEIDISKPVGERIQNLIYKNKPLKLNETLNLAINSHRYEEILKGKKLVKADMHWVSPISIRDYLVKYISEKKNISPEVNHNWKIIGYDFSATDRKDLIDQINEGKSPIPYNKSLRYE